MLDAYLRPVIDKPLNTAARVVDAVGIRANTVTWAGFILGLGAAYSIIQGQYDIALVSIILNRIADGLDGALARLQGTTDYGGYLDIVLDFIFYSSIPFAFVALNVEQNGIAGAFLIFSFIGTGGSFLAYAILAEKNKVTTDIRGKKSFYYLGGLTEGTETIGLFLLICIFPMYFAEMAWVFGALCWVTTMTRILAARETFKS